jgi:hypothetical protein
VSPHVLLAAQCALPGFLRIAQDVDARLRALGRRVDEPAGLAVLNLHDDSSHTAGNGRARLPEALRDRQSEALLDRLLDDCSRVHLEGVDLHRADVVEVGEDVDVRIAPGIRDCLVVEVPAFRVVMRHRADERQLHLGEHLFHQPVRVDDAERILPGIEAGDLRQQRPFDVDAELVDDVRRILGRERHVLRSKRIDRGRPDVTGRKALGLRHVLAHVEDRRVVPLDRREDEVEHLSIRCREVDVPAPDPVRT